MNVRAPKPAGNSPGPRWSAEPYVRTGLGIVLVFVVLLVVHPLLLETVWPSGIYNPVTGFDYDLLHPSPPSAAHLLGTDPLGRDVVSMIMEGTKPGLAVAVTASVASFLVSLLVGALVPCP